MRILTRILPTLLLMVAGASLPQAEAATKPHYLIGLQLYTVRDACAKDFPGTLKQVAEAGFTGVEFAGYYDYSAADLKKMLDDDHLAVYGSHTPLDDLLGDKFDKTVAFNKAIGNKFITVPWIPEERRKTHADILATAKLFSELAEKLNKEGIMLGYHDHGGDFQKVDGEYFWDTFFENASPLVKMQFDTGNAMSVGVQAAPFLKKYGHRVVSVHVKDFSATNKDALLGEGDVKWDDVIPMWKGKFQPKYFIIEQETYPFPSIVCAQKCLASLKKMLGVS